LIVSGLSSPSRVASPWPDAEGAAITTGEWPRDAFKRSGIDYLPANKSKSELYVEFLPHVNSAEVELLDNERLIHELLGLERRTARGGKDSTDHAPNAHDDVANAVAGATWLIHERPAFVAAIPIVVTVSKDFEQNPAHANFPWAREVGPYGGCRVMTDELTKLLASCQAGTPVGLSTYTTVPEAASGEGWWKFPGFSGASVSSSHLSGVGMSALGH
jgi:RES domain-containing protein